MREEGQKVVQIKVKVITCLGEEAEVVTSESLPLASLLFWTQKL